MTKVRQQNESHGQRLNLSEIAGIIFPGGTGCELDAYNAQARAPNRNSGSRATEFGSHFKSSRQGAVIRLTKAISYVLSIVGVCVLAPRTPAQTLASGQPIVIAASVVLDGKGHILHDVRILIEGSKIVAIGPKVEGPLDYDLRGLTVLPGWIDAHVHITWIFGKDGANAGTEGTTQEDAYQAASNAWVTLMAGFTTVQSVGAPNDIPLRDAIAKGILPGPRILTANEPLEGRGEATGTPDEIRAYVRKQKQAGADLIKIFASKSIRQGGGMTLSQEQLNVGRIFSIAANPSAV